MTFLLGTLSILHLLLLPGLVINLVSKRKLDFIETFLTSFVYSLLINFIFGFVILLKFSIYAHLIFQTIIGLEVIALISILISKIEVKNFNFIIGFPKSYLLFSLIILVCGMSSLYLYGTFWNTIPVDVPSYIRFAESFANGEMPDLNKTLGYPQLFSVIWAISMVVVGDLQIIIFIKFIMFCMFLVSNIIWIKLYFLSYKRIFLLSLLIYNFYIYAHFDDYVGSGMRDVEIGTMALLFFYFIYRFYDSSHQKYLGLALYSGAIASHTKQVGLILAIAGFFYLLSFIKKIYIVNIIKYFLTLLFSFIWFVYIEYNISIGLTSSDNLYLQKGIHEGRNVILRAWIAGTKFLYGASFKEIPIVFTIISLTLVLLFLLAIFHTKFLSFYFLTSAYFIVWTFYWSYDIRNLGIIVPYISLFAAESIIKFLNLREFTRIQSFALRINRSQLITLFVLIPLIFIIIGLKYDDTYLKRLSLRQENSIDEPERIKVLQNFISTNDVNLIGTQFNSPLRVNSIARYFERLDLEMSAPKLLILLDNSDYSHLYLRKKTGLTQSGYTLINELELINRLKLLKEDDSYLLFKIID
jgi:hypothetical protein